MGEKQIIGWREWISFPDLGIGHVKAKIDTGARTSALHAEKISYVTRCGVAWVRFVVHPLQRNATVRVHCEAPLLEHRTIRSSTGHQEVRPMIETTIAVRGAIYPVEITLAQRDVMGFRLLLGRQAIRDHFLIDAGHSFLGGRRKKKRKKKPKV